MKDWDSAALSLMKSETVRGYKIRRLPLGDYLRVLDTLKETPRTLLRACFPQEDAAQALEHLAHSIAYGLL